MIYILLYSNILLLLFNSWKVSMLELIIMLGVWFLASICLYRQCL